MANPTTGGWQPIPVCKKGGLSLINADYASQVILTVNILASLKINPTANIAAFVMGNSDAMLDFTALDGRLRTLEAATGISNVSNSNVTTIFQQVGALWDYVNVVYAQVNVVNAKVDYVNTRLDSGTASANCVGNAVQITFNFPS